MKNILFTIVFIATLYFLSELFLGSSKGYKDRTGEEFSAQNFVSQWLDNKTPQIHPTLPTIYVRWAQWCPGCIHSIPKNNELYHKYKEKLNMIAIANEWDDGTKEISRARIEYPSGFDPESTLDKFFEIKGIPFYAVISNQKILYLGHSLNEKTLISLFPYFDKKK